MQFYSPQQAIHDAYAIHMRSRGLVDPALRGSHDSDLTQWRIKEAAKVIACVERLEPHIRAWLIWCYTPLSETNQGWIKRLETQDKIRRCQREADRLALTAAQLPDKIAQCQKARQRAKLENMDTDQLLAKAEQLEQLAGRLKRGLQQPDRESWPLWDWLDTKIAERAPKRMQTRNVLIASSVCSIAFYNYRALLSHNKVALKRRDIISKLGINAEAYEKTFRPWTEWAYDTAHQVNESGLEQFARAVPMTKNNDELRS